MPPRVVAALVSYQSALDATIEDERKKDAPRVAERVEAVWKERRANKALKAVERTLGAMASGLMRCMYCEDSQGCDVEHGYPKVPYPMGAFCWLNLLLICAPCNRQKSDAFDAAMLDPTLEDPLDHLVLSFSAGRYTPRDDSQRGSATLHIVRRLASDQTLVRGRQNAFTKLRTFLRDYDACQAQERTTEADVIRAVVVEEPFSAVFAAILRASTELGATDVLGEELVAVVSRHPTMHEWLREADDARAAAAKPEIDALAEAVRIRRDGE